MFLFCFVFAMSLCASVYMCFVVTCWERADLLALFGVSSVSLSLSHWYPGSGVVLDCIDSWSLHLYLLFLFIVTPIVLVCNCSMYVVRYSISILVLPSSWSGRESWLLCLICLPVVSWWLCGSSLQCNGFVCCLWLWYYLIILTYYF